MKNISIHTPFAYTPPFAPSVQTLPVFSAAPDTIPSGDSFKPHAFEAKRIHTVTVIQPKVTFTRAALDKQAAYVHGCDIEIGWIGFVNARIVGGKTLDILVEDVMLLDQTCTSVETSIHPEALEKFALENPGLLPFFCYWGHSHVNMGTSPSGQDETQFALYRNTCAARKTPYDFFIRAILNKQGRMQIDVTLPNQGFEYRDWPWSIEGEARSNPFAQEIVGEIGKKVVRNAHTRFGKYWEDAAGETAAGWDDDWENYPTRKPRLRRYGQFSPASVPATPATPLLLSPRVRFCNSEEQEKVKGFIRDNEQMDQCAFLFIGMGISDDFLGELEEKFSTLKTDPTELEKFVKKLTIKS